VIAWPKDLLVLALAFLFSCSVTRIMIFLNIRDVPTERSSHKEITPRAGGVGLLFGFYMSVWAQGFPQVPFYEDWISLIILLCSAAVMGVMGFLDDIKGSSPIFKLLIQMGTAWFLVRCLGAFQTIPIPYFGEINLGPFSLLISIFWIVGFTNAFNFMDGVNGMSGIMTVISCIFLSILSNINHSDFQIHLILASATLGFLIFNFPKAKIFLGDVGSLFLGCLFAGWSLLALRPVYGKFSIWVIPLLFFIYLYDVIFTRIRRAIKGKSFLEAHCEHLYQLLSRTGWSHTKVTSVYALIFIAQGITSLFMITRPPEVHLLFLIPFLVGAIPFTWWVLLRARKAGVSF
jgi:UDP-N-acetylmuramyl pentapeptide phosphotransferase/UDP-N-acetylglucosamine-1-phosphate transferase